MVFKGLLKKEKNVFELESERIISLCDTEIEYHTILDILACACGLNHYANAILKARGGTLNDFQVLNLWELEICEKKIINKLNEAGEYNITHIEFIKEEISRRKENINNHDSFNLFEILSFAHLNHNTSHLINEDWSLNEHSVKAFIFSYSDSLETLVYENENYFNKYVSYLKNNFNYFCHGSVFDNFTERGYYYSTKVDNCIQDKNADGFLFDLIFKLKNKEKTIEQVYQDIQDIVNDERDFHYLNLDKKDLTEKTFFLLPAPYLLNKRINDSEIIGHTHPKLILGYNEKPVSNRLRGKTKTENKEIDHNVNIISAGSYCSGLSEFRYDIMTQDIFNDKAIVYFDSEKNNTIRDMVINIAKKADRRDDVLYLSLENAIEHINSKTLTKLFVTNKIIIIEVNSLIKLDIDIRKKIGVLYKTVFDEIIKFTEIDNNHERISIFLNNIQSMKIENLKELKHTLDNTDENQINFRLSCYDFSWEKEKKEILYSLLKDNVSHSIIMQCNVPAETLEFFDEKNKSSFGIDQRDIKNLEPSQFLYGHKLVLEHVLYKINYTDEYCKPSFYTQKVINNIYNL